MERSEKFESFEQDFARYLNSLERKVAQFSYQTKDNKELALNEGFTEVTDAEKCLRQMEIEVSMTQGSARIPLQSQVRRYREDFEKAKREFRAHEVSYADQKSKETLMGSRLENGASSGHKEKLLGLTPVLIEQTRRIEESKKQALECEVVAIDAMNHLKGQRDQIEGVRYRNNQIGENLSKGNRMIKSITRRALQNKLMLIGIALLLFGIIGFIIYLRLN